ncbi:hypothetical protein GV794_00360 [Nocardia cyriacigeorgica]|uniref:Uncharacterized protein n=1 Tax=Nocardia cyriacigeorgica TaxID=135487 RepID=A0A6P1D3T6_9NOCA|nr:hypothetical protein [Nocardia cyriacigeorgica]NEW38443.1 hypothetical protein [Nocardia cyriacigeorgica]NEW43593.1 hypothetical protein [Nocardia cyriacigeorgica]NEW49471.1 hypothetical protein [Nocardia cyriacigeorgica]NEW54125.1 hypothetical protein [Nocardia cyriacigeorgica]
MQLTNLNMHVASLLACGNDPGVMTSEQAHAAMQLHLDCTVDECRVRRRARATLVEAGRCVLDDRALR